MQQDPGICSRSLCFGVTRGGRYRASAGNRLTRSPIDPFPSSRAGERQSSFRDFLDTSSAVGNRNFDRVQERRTKDTAKRIYGAWSGLRDRINSRRVSE